MSALIGQPVQEVSHGESTTTPLAPNRVDFRPRPGPTQELLAGVRGVHRKESDRKAGFEAGNGGCGFQHYCPASRRVSTVKARAGFLVTI